jgi:hypothetical protein
VPVRAAQLLLRCPSREALAALLSRALRRQKLAAGGSRELRALVSSGWACVVEKGRADFGLARLLSEGGEGVPPGEVLALELDGGRFQLRWRAFLRGEPGALREEPPALGAHLPLVCDVEQEAWDALAAAGVPAELRLWGFEDARIDEGAAELEPGPAGALGLRATASAEEIAILPCRCAGPERAEGPSPPVQPDSLVKSEAGELLALEVRRLPALPPTPEAAGALAAVEEQQALRLCLWLGPLFEEERLPRPAFVYETRYQRELGALLETAREERPWLCHLLDPGAPSPLSHAGFASRALRLLAAHGTRVLRAHGLSLELQHPQEPFAALLYSLAPRWQAMLLGEEPEPAGRGPSVIADEAMNRLREPVPPLAGLPRWALLSGLLPTLSHDPALPGAPLQARGAQADSPSPRVCLLCEAQGLLRPVTADALSAAGLSLEEALARALENEGARTLAEPGGLHFFELEHGPVAMTSFTDAGGAGRLASPAFRALLLRLLGPSLLLAAPTRDTLLACDDNEEARAWLEDEAGRRRSEGPFPLPGPIFALDEGGLRVTSGPP